MQDSPKNGREMTDHIFVYGTLMRGQSNHRLIEGKYQSVRSAATRGLLFDLGAFPGAIFTDIPELHMGYGYGDFIFGEVFTFTNVETILPALDRLEGVPTLYRRVQVRLCDPETLEPDDTKAWAYEFHRRPSDDQFIPNGIWQGRNH